MVARDELVRMFKELEPNTQLDVWNQFVFENDGEEFDLNYCEDAIDNQKNFWECRKEVYEDNSDRPGFFEDVWEVEVAKTVQLSKNYRFHEKYVRYYYDAEIREWVLESSNYVLDLIKKRYDVPMYEHDVFVEWFGKYVMDKLNGKGE